MDAKRKAIPKSIRMTVYQKCEGHCAYCGCSLEYKDMQVDHVIPLNGWSEQGTDTVDNMLPACRSCNHYKSRSTLEGFRKMVSAMPDTLMRDSNTYKNAVRFGLVIPNKKPVVFYFEKNNQTEHLELKGEFMKVINASTIGNLISAHIEGDEKKFLAFANFIADAYEEAGEERSARIIRKRIDGTYKNEPQVTLD